MIAHLYAYTTDHDHDIEQSPFTGTLDYVFAAKNAPCLDYSIASIRREIFTSESYSADGRRCSPHVARCNDRQLYLHDLCTGIFRDTGDYWLSTAQMIEIGPGSKAQPLHADAAAWWPFLSMGGRWMPEVAVNFLIAATDTTSANGATGVVEGSHKINYSEALADPTFDFWKFPDDKVKQVELKAGDCLLLGGRIVHRGEANRTADERRRLLSCTVTSSVLTPEEAHPLILDKDVVRGLPERVKKFLGFRGQSSISGYKFWQDHRTDLSQTLGL
ncbi:Fum3p [Verticillium alfalfae VaMs.102]|uniref:Fum3p n=1 Tax=Verticillium alfalfae (strain VaMs.102 / ATCC MYA-4576 / FGSC 10136) TaxID=526221 RepID=C9SYH1_VERA1|nr:Fum3p [Verticillium alfalfae VaMs.102]EEY23836.1 Fum3p [Verticillium alfalfae VaMs.102]